MLTMSLVLLFTPLPPQNWPLTINDVIIYQFVTKYQTGIYLTFTLTTQRFHFKILLYYVWLKNYLKKIPVRMWHVLNCNMNVSYFKCVSLYKNVNYRLVCLKVYKELDISIIKLTEKSAFTVEINQCYSVSLVLNEWFSNFL